MRFHGNILGVEHVTVLQGGASALIRVPRMDRSEDRLKENHQEEKITQKFHERINDELADKIV